MKRVGREVRLFLHQNKWVDVWKEDREIAWNRVKTIMLQSATKVCGVKLTGSI